MGKILAVNDDGSMLFLLRMILEEAHYQVDTASGGEEALEKIHRDDFDLIVLDILMPQPNGFTVMKQLRSSPATASIPIIVLTALGDEASRQKAVEMGAQYFISKPFLIKDLVKRVEEVLDNQKAYSLTLPVAR